MARLGDRIRGPKRPLTTRREKRLAAWFFALMIACAALSVLFFPALMAIDAAQSGDGTGLEGVSLFVVMLPGLFTSVLYLVPVWFALRWWLGRQPEDRDIGAKPAVFPVWLVIWTLFTALQSFVVGEARPAPPPAPLDLIPYPMAAFFNGVILAKMAAMTVMFAVYRAARPQPD